jgi:four helix bundle protein
MPFAKSVACLQMRRATCASVFSNSRAPSYCFRAIWRAYLRRDFAAKNAIAAKEMRETLFWLRLIRACRLCPEETVQPLQQEAHELTAMLTAGMKRLHPASPSSQF